MLKPNLAKLLLFLALVVLSFSPLLLVGSGLAIVLPVALIFWLAGLAQARGAQVTDGPGVDAFSLVPSNVLGIILIVLGSAVSLAVLYTLASFLVNTFSRR